MRESPLFIQENSTLWPNGRHSFTYNTLHLAYLYSADTRKQNIFTHNWPLFFIWPTYYLKLYSVIYWPRESEYLEYITNNANEIQRLDLLKKEYYEKIFYC